MTQWHQFVVDFGSDAMASQKCMDRECKIQIESDEKTGEMTLEINGKKQNFVYDGFNKIYEIGVHGSDAKGLLTITGLTKSYSIVLTNAKVYDGQLEKLEAQTSNPETGDETITEPSSEGRRK